MQNNPSLLGFLHEPSLDYCCVSVSMIMLMNLTAKENSHIIYEFPFTVGLFWIKFGSITYRHY